MEIGMENKQKYINEMRNKNYNGIEKKKPRK